MLAVGQGSANNDTFNQIPFDELFREVNSAGVGMNDVNITDGKIIGS
jgi:hypothetical protein